MATIERFEDIRCWQLSKELAKQIYSITKAEEFAKDFALKDQIRRAAGSIMHNIAEGFEAGSDKEFVRFLRYSLRSAAEVQSQLYLALELDYIDRADFDLLYKAVLETKQNLHGFIAYLVRSGKKKSLHEVPSEYIIDSKEDFETSRQKAARKP